MSISKFLLLVFASCFLQLALVKAQEFGLSSSGVIGNGTLESTGGAFNDTSSSTGNALDSTGAALPPNTTFSSSTGMDLNNTGSTGGGLTGGLSGGSSGASGASGASGSSGSDGGSQEAHDEEEDDWNNDDCKARTNNVEMSDDGFLVMIDAPSATSGISDSLGCHLSTIVDGGFLLNLVFKSDIHSNQNDFSFDFKGFSILEFKGDGAFDMDDSVVVQNISIGAGGWQPFTQSGPDNNGLTTFTAISMDDMFALVVTIATSGVSVGGKFYNPNQINFDLNIRNWQYMANDTRLCMEGKFNTSFDLGDDDAEEEHADDDNGQHGTVTFGNDDLRDMGFQGIFKWRQMATIDDQFVAVLSSKVTEVKEGDDDFEDNGNNAGRQYRIFFTFDQHIQGAQLLWDPVVGVAYVDSDDMGAAASMTTSVFAVVFAVACALFGQ